MSSTLRYGSAKAKEAVESDSSEYILKDQVGLWPRCGLAEKELLSLCCSVGRVYIVYAFEHVAQDTK